MDRIRQLVNANPDAVKYRTDDPGQIPLHTACGAFDIQGGLSQLEVVQYLVEQWPESVTTANNNGYLPLHVACYFNASLAVVQYLVQQWPESVKHRNSYGETPLDIATRQEHPNNWLNPPWRDRFN
jgi:ankyrin repeat protein